MEEIDVAIFAFDRDQQSASGESRGREIAGAAVRATAGNYSAAALGLAEFLGGEEARTIQLTFPGGSGRWGIHRSTFRKAGLPHQLLVVTDLSRALREEELQAWQRLVRVLGHELNNSLAPIQSVAQSLESGLRQSRVRRRGRPGATAGLVDDMRQGFGIIGRVPKSLGRFMAAYSRMARLPPPKLAPVDVREWISRVAKLETRVKLRLEEGPDGSDFGRRGSIGATADQSGAQCRGCGEENGGAEASIGWSRQDSYLNVWVADEGPGISNPANLFVPFFTTKQGGRGLGWCSADRSPRPMVAR